MRLEGNSCSIVAIGEPSSCCESGLVAVSLIDSLNSDSIAFFQGDVIEEVLDIASDVQVLSMSVVGGD